MGVGVAAPKIRTAAAPANYFFSKTRVCPRPGKRDPPKGIHFPLKPADFPREAMLNAGFAEEDLDGTWKPYRAVGCSSCNNGYKGRVGIYQVMPISEEIQRIILRDGSAMEIAEQSSRDGVRTLRESGLSKVRLGMTSLDEVLACTNA